MRPEDVDLDRYVGPERDPARLAERREALLDQLGWLTDEAEALGPLLAGLPAWALTAAPMPGDRSVKEALARLAALDRGPRRRWLDRLAAEDEPALDSAEPAADPEGAGERAVEDLLADLRAARQSLLDVLAALPADVWGRPATLDGAAVTLYDLTLGIARHDADELRALAYRLHESHLTSRPEDLPK